MCSREGVCERCEGVFKEVFSAPSSSDAEREKRNCGACCTLLEPKCFVHERDEKCDSKIFVKKFS